MTTTHIWLLTTVCFAIGVIAGIIITFFWLHFSNGNNQRDEEEISKPDDFTHLFKNDKFLLILQEVLKLPDKIWHTYSIELHENGMIYIMDYDTYKTRYRNSLISKFDFDKAVNLLNAYKDEENRFYKYIQNLIINSLDGYVEFNNNQYKRLNNSYLHLFTDTEFEYLHILLKVDNTDPVQRINIAKLHGLNYRFENFMNNAFGKRLAI